MTSRNIFVLLTIISVIFLTSYLLYHTVFSKQSVKDKSLKLIYKKPKQVRFSDKILYKTLENSLSDSNNCIDLENSLSGSNNYIDLENGSFHNNDENNLYDNQNTAYSKVYADTNESNNLKWDSYFNLPIIDEKKKKQFVSKMKRQHAEYGISMNDFVKYKNDQSKVISNLSTVDPFGKKQKNKLKNKSIAEIYDNQVKNPSAKPMKIAESGFNKKYENESELNGGKLQQSNLSGFTSDDMYSQVDFGDQF